MLMSLVLKNVIRWSLSWLPLWVCSRKYASLLWIASPYHHDEIKSIMRILEEECPDLFSVLESQPTIICDARFGSDECVTRFDPPFKCRTLTIVNSRGTAPEVLQKKIMTTIRKLADDRNVDAG